MTVTPIPPPASVTEFRADLPRAKKLKVAKKKSIPKTMLSRTERHQMALLAPKTKAGEGLLDVANDEDAGSGIADLDLHRSFSRPKLTEIEGQDNDDVDDDDDLPDTIKLRLYLARMKAVQAHQRKFS
ncbi:hypothetical protein [Dechloromonas sp. A34]|uniref:hypothetical protein n=1 Tax=Dechloromonas sp. A34 TaxID=447588 RepID=UPI0022499295|nr:hypothetical protein [Dechloromonas sp. A34]